MQPIQATEIEVLICVVAGIKAGGSLLRSILHRLFVWRKNEKRESRRVFGDGPPPRSLVKSIEGEALNTVVRIKPA
jgi:hypothetical protein